MNESSKIKIYTSCFSNLKNLPKEKCVAISQGVPVFYHGASDKRLAPPWSMVRNHGLTQAEWKNKYFEQLEKYHPREIAESLNDKILLCWETVASGKPCHRHYLVEWLKKKNIELDSSEWP